MGDCLSVHAIDVFFGRKIILSNITTTFAPNTITAIVGPNGAGKTTFLLTLAGTITPNNGYIDRHGMRPAFLGHSLMLYEDFSGYENIMFYKDLWMTDYNKDAILDIIKEVGLEKAIYKPVKAYSRGMKQRLSIARLLISNSPIWLLDEPETGLDRKGRQWLAALLKSEKRNRCIILSSHFPEFVQDVADNLLLIESGKLQGVLKNTPENVTGAFGISGSNHD